MWINKEEYELLNADREELLKLRAQRNVGIRHDIEEYQKYSNGARQLEEVYSCIVKEKDAEIAQLKSIVPRKTLLATYSFGQLQNIAVTEYGLDIDHCDKRDLIEDITDIERKLKIYCEGEPCKK